MLADAGVITEQQLATTLAEWLGLRVVDPQALQPEAEALRRVPQAVAEREGVLPLMLHGDTLVVAVPDPWDQRLLDELRFMAERRVVAVARGAGHAGAGGGAGLPGLQRGPQPPRRHTGARGPAACADLAASQPARPGRPAGRRTPPAADPGTVSRSPTTPWCAWSTA
jgi:hypothetical protein